MTQRLREHRRRRRVRRVLRARRVDAHRRRSLRRRQHGARVRRHHRLLPGRRRTRSPTCARPGATRHSRARRGVHEAHRPLVRPGAPTPRYTRVDRDRPRDRRHERRRTERAAGPAAYSRRAARWQRCSRRPRGRRAELPRHPIAIAAITSCTNTSDPRLLVAAGLLARKARAARARGARRGSRPRSRPGSPAAARYLARAGLIDDLVGARASTSSATAARRASATPDRCPSSARRGGGRVSRSRCSRATATFPGRVHPDLDLGFIMSPPLVIAFALAGRRGARPARRAGRRSTPTAAPVTLERLWPTDAEIDAAHGDGPTRGDFGAASTVASRNPAWHALEAPTARAFPGTRARRSCAARPSLRPTGSPARPLHRLPAAGARRRHHHRPHLAGERDPAGQPGGRLPGRARRGSRRPQRLRLAPRQLGSDAARGLPQQDAGQPARARGAGRAHAARAQRRGRCRSGRRPSAIATRASAVVLVAGERYGTGSSRDWAAKGQRLLGIRAVLAVELRAHPPLEPDRHGHPAAAAAAGATRAARAQPGDRIESTRRRRASPPVRGPGRVLRGAAARASSAPPRWKPNSSRLLRDGGVLPDAPASDCAASAQPPEGARPGGLAPVARPRADRRADPRGRAAVGVPSARAAAGRPAAGFALARERRAGAAEGAGAGAARSPNRGYFLARRRTARARVARCYRLRPGMRTARPIASIAEDRLRG